MPTMISAVHGTGNIQSERKVVDMKDTIAYLEPDSAPLLVITKRAAGKSSPTHNPKFSCLEAPVQPRWDAINLSAGYTPSDVSVVVDNSSYFAVDDLVKVPRTGEIFKVTAVTTATHTLTIVRGYGTTTGAALENNDPLLIIGNAHEEGAALGNIRTVQLEVFYNYTRFGCVSEKSENEKLAVCWKPVKLQSLIDEIQEFVNRNSIEDISAISR